MPKRQLLIINVVDPATVNDSFPQTEPLGDLTEVISKLAEYNTAADSVNGNFLYGPGLIIQLPMSGNEKLTQLLISLADEDIAWPVLERICRKYQWQLMDPDSGRTLSYL